MANGAIPNLGEVAADGARDIAVGIGELAIAGWTGRHPEDGEELEDPILKPNIRHAYSIAALPSDN